MKVGEAQRSFGNERVQGIEFFFASIYYFLQKKIELVLFIYLEVKS
jgi:hypothetical protein